VIATSQSGRSAEVVDLVKGIDSENVLAVTNYGPSPLGDLAKHHINLGNHSDSSVSFLSYTSTVLAFGMLADHWSGTLDVKNWENIVETALSGFENAKSALDAAAHMITDGPSFADFVAPAPLASAGEEAALMFREGPLTPATAMETRLYLHGPMDVAGPGAHVIIGGDREALLAKQLGEKTSSVVFIRTDPHVAAPETVATTVDLATTADGAIGQAIEATIMAQYLALKTAEYKRVEIDAPVFTRLDTKTSEAVS
jgi:glucosamine--fructose-6-phosphate aminotransferase (isomerizing)